MTAPSDPPPLTSSDDALARLLREANSEYATPVDETRAWRKLESTYSRRQESRQARNLYLTSSLLVAAAGFLIWGNVRATPPPLRVEADPAVVSGGPRPRDVTSVEPPLLPAATPKILTPAAASGTAPAAPRPLNCKPGQFSGKPADRALCLEQDAKGDDLRAEQALVELATLKSRVPSQRAYAMRLLDDYKKRFPAGALRGEVDFDRVTLLSELGEYRRAFDESEILLRTAWGRARSSELHLLRGRIAQDRFSDFSVAIAEFAFVRSEFGRNGDDAAFRTAQCLEASGSPALAAQAYRDYLKRPHAEQAERANLRLEELGRR